MSRITWSEEYIEDDTGVDARERLERVAECINLLCLAKDCDQTQVHLADAVLEDLKDLSDEIGCWRNDFQDAADDARFVCAEKAALMAQGKCPVCKGVGTTTLLKLPGFSGGKFKCVTCDGSGKYEDAPKKEEPAGAFSDDDVPRDCRLCSKVMLPNGSHECPSCGRVVCEECIRSTPSGYPRCKACFEISEED
jgi:hypothetical protein